MDAFNVPKKVNRHVLKAVNLLSQGAHNSKGVITTAQILHQVKYQMRNLVPVPNIDLVIQKSLENLNNVGLIKRIGTQKYKVGNSYLPLTSLVGRKQNTVERRHFGPNVSRKRSVSVLNPNVKRTQYMSDDSLSGDDYDRARKRMRTNNKKIKYVGNKTELPKARQHSHRDDLETTASMMSYLSDGCLEQSLGMSLLIGPEDNTNRDHDYSSKSRMPPLIISEITADDTPTTTLKVQRLFVAKEANNDISSTSCSTTSILPSKADSKEKRLSETSVNSNQVTPDS